jgi:hypothetical protein
VLFLKCPILVIINESVRVVVTVVLWQLKLPFLHKANGVKE